jgi:hypothetical protein
MVLNHRKQKAKPMLLERFGKTDSHTSSRKK